MKLIKQFERESNLDVYSLGLDKAKWESRLEAYTLLIVRECVDVVTSKCASPTAREALIEHFGIKE